MTQSNNSSLVAYKNSVKKVYTNHTYKIKNSFGVYDAYRYISRNKWLNIGQSISTKNFYLIIRTINKYYANELSVGNDVKLPHRMGRLEVGKANAFVRFNGNKIETNRRIDWNKTLELWYEDEAAKNRKQLVRVNSDVVFKLRYTKRRANYENKSYFRFAFTRKVKQALKENILENKIEAFKTI